MNKTPYLLQNSEGVYAESYIEEYQKKLFDTFCLQ